MSDPIEDYLKRVDDHLTLEPVQRQQVLSELRSHLWETATEMHRAQVDRSMSEIQAQVVADFGSPADLALGYNPEGSVVLTNASGSTVLTFSAAVTRAGRVAGEVATRSAKAVGKGATVLGRGVGRLAKVALIVLAVLVGVALLSASVVAVFLFDDIKAIVEQNMEDDVFHQSVSCRATACNQTHDPAFFFLHDEAKRVRFYVSGHDHDPDGNGSVAVRVIDPAGITVLNRTFSIGESDSFYETGRWAPVSGYWSVQLAFASFEGSVSLRVDAAGMAQ